MLTYMRKNASSWIIKVLFGAIIITFVFFYGYSPEKDSAEQVLATVGEKKITEEHYKNAYANMIQMYQQMYQNQISDSLARTLGLRENLLDQMIEQELLLQEAERRNLQVARQQVTAAIMKQPYMQENGVFSESRYAAVLKSMKMTAAEYERQAGQEIMLQGLRAMISQGVNVSDNELQDLYRLRGEKLSIDYLEFTQADISEDMQASEEELQAYYGKNSENFRVKETAEAQYLVFDPKEFAGRMHVDDEEIRQFYAADQGRFVEPEQIRARHILLKADPSAEPGKKQARKAEAQGLVDKLTGGADFAELAKKHSQDESTAASGGDLGFFSRGAMVGPFEEAAFGLQPGQVSGVVETRFGYHIIKQEEKKPERLRPLEEVRAEITAELQQDMAEREVRAASRRAFNRLFGSRDLEGYAHENGLALQKTGVFAFGERPEDAQSENAFSRQAFALQPGELSPVFSVDKKYYLLKLTARAPSHVAALENVRDKVLAEVQREKRIEKAHEKARAVLAMLTENGFDWKAAAKKYRLEIKQAELARMGDQIPGLGVNPELKQAAFKLGDGQTADRVFKTGSGAVVIRAHSKKLPPEDGFTAEKEGLRQQILEAKQQEAFKGFIQELKQRYSVSVNQELFEAI